MTQALTTNESGRAMALEAAAIGGDLARLQPSERVMYYTRVCESLGLNPLTQPFAYITLNGKLTLYAKRDATDQLRSIHGISVSIASREFLQDAGLYVVTARATSKDARTDESIGAVNVKGLQGENMANALMKAETKAKRRVTLSIAGLGWLDESETGSVVGAAPVEVDSSTGEIVGSGAMEPTDELSFLIERQAELGFTKDDLKAVLAGRKLSAWIADNSARGGVHALVADAAKQNSLRERLAGESPIEAGEGPPSPPSREEQAAGAAAQASSPGAPPLFPPDETPAWWGRLQDLMGPPGLRPVDLQRVIGKPFSLAAIDGWREATGQDVDDLVALALQRRSETAARK